MKTSVFQKLWEENKRFLLVTGAGLLVFLFLYSLLVSGTRGVAESTNQAIFERLEPDVKRLHRLLKDDYHAEKNRLDSFDALETELLERFAFREPRGSKKTSKGSWELYFQDKLDEIWKSVNRIRSEKSLDVELPPKVSTRDLEVFSDDGPLEIRRHHLDIELLRRALHLLVESGVRRIEQLKPLQEEVLGIRINEDYRIVYHRLSIRARGSFESFARILRRVGKTYPAEDGGGIMQTLLLDLSSKGVRGADDLRGQLEFAAFYLEELGEDEEFQNEPRSSPTKRRRRR